MPAMRTAARPATTRSVVVVLACIAVLAAITTIAQRYGFSGLAVDREAVRSWLTGGDLYAYRSPLSQLGTALPPPALILLSPAGWLPLGLAGWLTALAGVGALGLALVAVVGPVARRYGRRRWPAVLAAGALALTVEPVRATLGLGALDLLVFGLVTADIVALRRSARARRRATWRPARRPGRRLGSPPAEHTAANWVRRAWGTGAWAGLGTGIAAALAVTPAVFIGYLAVTRQWRAALTATGTALLAAIGALILTPHETLSWFGEVLWRVDRTGPVDAIGNQSLAGVLARMYHSATVPVLLWLSFALLLLAVGFIRARAAHAEGDEVAAFTLVGLTAAVVGPVTKTHELVWMLPATLIMIDVAARRRGAARASSPASRSPASRSPGSSRRPGLGFAVAAGATYLLFVLAPMWSLRDALSGNAYGLALIVMVNALPWRPGVAPAAPADRRLRPGRPNRAPGRAVRRVARSGGLHPAEPARLPVAGGPLPAVTIPPPRDPARHRPFRGS